MNIRKKIFTFCSAVLVCGALFGAELQIRFMPSVGLQTQFDDVVIINGTVSLDLNIITVRKRDDIYISLQGTPQYFMAEGLSPFLIYDANFAAGYNFRINDRFSAGLEALCGMWFFPSQSEMDVEAGRGVLYGGRVSGDYHINPYLAASFVAAYKQFSHTQEPFMNKFEIGLGIKYNFSKGLLSRSSLNVENYEVSPLFPVFYSRYEDNNFGNIRFKNNEKNDITDVTVSVFIEQFMSVPNTVATYERIGQSEEFSVELSAFLNENILNQLQNQLSDAVISVSYRNLGVLTEFSHTVSLQTLTRNSMSWEDDRSAAAFVSAKDGAVQRFAKRIALALKDKTGTYPNGQYAEAVFKVLKAYGINYVIDPASAFTDNVGTASIDFLQFPYQTLLYHGGDCDDLSILNCSLLEALGVSTAFITIPGHIYMAYDSGVPLDSADSRLGRGKYISAEGKAWIPVEITVPQDSYALALSLGIKQWNKYPEEHAIIPLSKAWEEYKPVSVPASDITLQFPKEALR